MGQILIIGALAAPVRQREVRWSVGIGLRAAFVGYRTDQNFPLSYCHAFVIFRRIGNSMQATSHTFVARHAPDAANCPHRQCTPERHVDHQFVAMLNAYRASGGLGRIQEILKMLKSHDEKPDLTLASWILKRKVICFEWRSMTWLPWFQFRPADMDPQPELAPVLAELASVFDPWEMANWFAQPNPWLADCPPVDSLLVNPPAVLQAARADRFVAGG